MHKHLYLLLMLLHEDKLIFQLFKYLQLRRLDSVRPQEIQLLYIS